MTVIEAISALEKKVKPVVIFKGVNPQSSWFPDEKLPDWAYTRSENAWTSKEIALAWLKEVFLEETKLDDGGYRILIIDGHKSHITEEFMWLCFTNKV